MACLALFSSTYKIHCSEKKTQKKRAGELEEDYINLAIFDTVASENWRAEVSCSYNKFTLFQKEPEKEVAHSIYKLHFKLFSCVINYGQPHSNRIVHDSALLFHEYSLKLNFGKIMCYNFKIFHLKTNDLLVYTSQNKILSACLWYGKDWG